MPPPDPKASASSAKTVTRRRRGRPSAHENGMLDDNAIIACAFELAKTVPLQELSIVRVARELGVTPALIHYYLDGRDALTSGVMNTFYREMLSDWPELTGRWREDIEAAVGRVYRTYVKYAGVAAYVVSHNRFRMKHLVGADETDYGILLFERYVGVVREAGFDAARTAMYANLLMEFTVSGAYATVRHRWPGEHSNFLDHVLGELDPGQYPNAHYVRRYLGRLQGDDAFSEGMHLVLNGIEVERSKLPNVTIRKGKRGGAKR